MKTLIPYIAFQGDCREALDFYVSAFNGEVTSIQTFSESPIQVSKEQRNRIFDSEFKADNIHFKASDDLPEHPVRIGTNISLFVSFTDKTERKSIFKILSESGKVLFPLDGNFGMLQDKYGVQWMFVGNT